MVFLLILLFYCYSACDFGIRICSVRHSPRDSLAISGQTVCHYLGGVKGGGRGVKETGDKRRQGGRGFKNRDFYGDNLFEWPHSTQIS